MSQLIWHCKSFIKNAVPNTLREKLSPRRCHALCVGTPKSGTTSVADMFEKNYRAAHEPERIILVDAIYDHYHSRMNDEQYVRFLLKHEKRIWLEFESNCFLGYRPDLVYRAFPDAKFILTVREPKSWLDSIFNNNINYPTTKEPTFAYWHEVFFEPKKFQFSDYDTPLQEHNLYPLDAYLTYWMSANQGVIEAIPQEQLLTLDTRALKTSADILASFLSIPTDSINVESSHGHVTKKKFDIVKLIDTDYLNDRISTLCESPNFNF